MTDPNGPYGADPPRCVGTCTESLDPEGKPLGYCRGCYQDIARPPHHPYGADETGAPSLVAALEAALPVLEQAARHYDCEDCWYSCATLTCDEGRRSDECDCRARNAIPALALARNALAARHPAPTAKDGKEADDRD